MMSDRDSYRKILGICAADDMMAAHGDNDVAEALTTIPWDELFEPGRDHETASFYS